MKLFTSWGNNLRLSENSNNQHLVIHLRSRLNLVFLRMSRWPASQLSVRNLYKGQHNRLTRCLLQTYAMLLLRDENNSDNNLDLLVALARENMVDLYNLHVYS